MSRRKGWDALDERAYLERIGECLRERGYTVSRKSMLEGYLAGAVKRVIWGEIDSEACLRYCRSELSNERD